MPTSRDVPTLMGSRVLRNKPGTGTIVQAAFTITGTATQFISEVRIGDRIQGGAIDCVVTNVISDIALTVDVSAVVAVGVAFTISSR